MNTPQELMYSKDHEWVRVVGNTAAIGITDYAQDALGDVVYVQLPNVGDVVVVAQVIGEVESTKSVSEIYSPLAGKVCKVNVALDGEPNLLNSDPYGDGWICEVEFVDAGALSELMDAAAYQVLVEGE